MPFLRNFAHKNALYQTYPSGATGIFRIATPPGENCLRVAVAADWGAGTLEADTIAENMKASAPHVTVHLGDVYYVGEAAEIEENCLGKPTDNYTGVQWPLGSTASFALMGNHEMYSGGQGYFNNFLNTLGLLNSDRTVKTPQSASYFCLETEHWLVLGLDTGYHSGGWLLFTSVPGLNALPFFNVDARFDDKMMLWLEQTMKTELAGGTNKPILLLTHHQPVSSFEHAFTKPAKQLAQLEAFKGRELVWLYGHEHRLTVYKEQPIAGLKIHPRCIGHGGVPVEVTRLKRPDPNILYYDPREHPIDEEDPNTKVGYNGHVVLLFEGPRLTVEYREITDNNLLLTETFTPRENGALSYAALQAPDSQLIPG